MTSMCFSVSSGAKTPEDEHRAGNDPDANAHEADSNKAFLPGLPPKPRCCDGRKGCSPEGCSKRGYEPIDIGTVQRGPVRDRLCQWRQFHLGPETTTGN